MTMTFVSRTIEIPAGGSYSFDVQAGYSVIRIFNRAGALIVIRHERNDAGVGVGPGDHSHSLEGGRTTTGADPSNGD